ncbi:MAG: O-antigen ligase family protein [Pseudomonadota bacterium]
MTTNVITSQPKPPDVALKRNGINQLVLVLVWLAVASSAIVFTEPAPVDALTFGLIAAIPIVGLFAVRAGTLVVALGLAVIGAATLIGATQIVDDFTVAAPYGADLTKGIIHSVITIYLLLAALIFTGFVALRPYAHTRLIFSALIVAGLLASLAGVVGYFGVSSLATDLFVKFDRASGTFKDPNVLGAFLVLPLLAAAHLVLHGRRFARLAGIAASGIILLAIFLTFSRGAWLMLAASFLIYTFLAFVTARTHRQRLSMVLLFGCAMLGAMGVVGAALQSPDIGEFFLQRAQASQAYDTGPEGRFGGQVRAVSAIVEHPLGIGAMQFVPRYHPENPHNVYLNFFLKSGWIGGFAYVIAILMTLLFGLGHAIRRTPHQHLFQAAFAGFIGLVVIGFIIDTDHWRHFFLNASLVWGMMAAAPRRDARLVGVRRQRRPARIVSVRLQRNRSPIRRRRILGPARRRLRRELTSPRRPRTWQPRRPQRIAYGAANDA